jgi:rubrerythrin
MIDFKKLDMMDALDLAILIEEEAAERYQEFANELGHRYEGDAADFFTKMVGNEIKHRDQLKSRREKLFANKPTKMEASMIWDVEAPAPGKPRAYMSVRQSIEVAIESEIKAFDFFNQALKNIGNSEIKALFTELRDEEAEHKATLEKFLTELPPGEGADKDDSDGDEPSAL